MAARPLTRPPALSGHPGVGAMPWKSQPDGPGTMTVSPGEAVGPAARGL